MFSVHVDHLVLIQLIFQIKNMLGSIRSSVFGFGIVLIFPRIFRNIECDNLKFLLATLHLVQLIQRMQHYFSFVCLFLYASQQKLYCYCFNCALWELQVIYFYNQSLMKSACFTPIYHLDTGHKLNVQKKFRRRPEHVSCVNGV